MPLLKRKPFPLADPPKDLEHHEFVYQVRFTKEIFHDYNEYLSRINLYRRRVWMCKFTGKTNLTYEEALVSEKCAAEKVQQFPKELMVPTLQIIQYSMLSLKDLADTIAVKLQDCMFVGIELYGKKDDQIYPCKIVKVIEKGAGKVQYEVVWLDRSKKVTESALLNAEDLIRKKPPLSRRFLKSFIRESTYRSAPWVLHDKLAQNHRISTDLPLELRSTAFFRDGLLVCNKRRKINDMETDQAGKRKRKNIERGNGSTTENVEKNEDDQLEEGLIKYPIDDLLVQPSIDDPVFSERPSPSRDFKVPMDCIGDLLMVWDFCSSFSRLLHLWPFCLEDFESAIYHKDSNALLVESHSAFLRLLLKDNGEYFSVVQEKKRKMKITLVNWTEYLCDFLELIGNPELRANTATIKRGHYGLLDAHAKLGILCELVNQSLESIIFRVKLDETIEQRQALGSTRRGEALEEGKKKRQEKERLKSEPDSNGLVNGHHVEKEAKGVVKVDHGKQNRDSKNRNGVVMPSQNGISPVKSEDDHPIALLKKMMKQNKLTITNTTNSSRKEAQEEKIEVHEKRTKEQRREYYEREMEKRSVKTNPLGRDRNHNRYWWFRRDGRIFVESSDSKQWGYYCSVEELDALKDSLNCKGERERALNKQLEKYYNRMCVELNKRSKDLSNQIASEEAVLRRSTRVRAPPRENPATAYLRYVNKWKEE